MGDRFLGKGVTQKLVGEGVSQGLKGVTDSLVKEGVTQELVERGHSGVSGGGGQTDGRTDTQSQTIRIGGQLK